jgi:signal transduction histidine kinase
MEIVVVDDDASQRTLTELILKKAGHTSITVSNGLEAFEIIKKHPIRIVVTDWLMPFMNGLELCRKIRAASLNRYIYIILITAKFHPEDMVEGLESGADDFITKPFSPSGLLARLRTGIRIVQLEDEHKKTMLHLLQSEKMASIGQLAAGLAHEINNPTGFVSSNLNTLSKYNSDLIRLFALYQSFLNTLERSESLVSPALSEEISQIRRFEADIDIEYLKSDIVELIKDCCEGAERIKKIVMDLKDFAHPGEDKPSFADINACLESTLHVIGNEIKYNAKIHKEFGALPSVRCYPQRLNQVFLNVIVNASQAIDSNGDITIRTRHSGHFIEIEIADNGCGISQENLSKIFDPFFTTKEVGKGTGLGLHVAYKIIQEHKGRIDVESEVGKGTCFKITIPVEEEGS